MTKMSDKKDIRRQQRFADYNNVLPEGWNLKRLGEATEIVNGGTPKSSINKYWQGSIQWVTPKDMGQLQNDYVSNTSRTISSLGLKKSSAKVIPANSVILSTRAPIGHVAINQVNMAFNQGCRGLIPLKEADGKFLFYFLKANRSLLNDLGVGTTFKELSKKALAEIQIPLPTLSEQKRIVAILDKTLGAISKAIANTEKNIKNTQEIFDSRLNDVLRNGRWQMVNTGEIAEIIAGQSPEGKYYNRKGEGLPFYQGKSEFTEMFIGKPKKWTTKAKKLAGKNDILMSVRAPVGPVNLATQKICIGRGLSAIKPKKINQIFLFYCLKSIEGQVKGSSGAVFDSINKKQIEQIKIPLPPLSEQKRIVSELNVLTEKTKRLEKTYQQKIENLEELRQSLMKKAFDGKLNAD